ncbi:PD-(D/E)XK nuclease-like domain-containing protein [bacterium]|nr:PD-(D/E)XK nuclease-like domain-containing protein [bacterium]
MNPGLYKSMEDSEYRAIDALSNSDLMAWAKGEGAGKINPRAALLGTGLHAKILEPDVAAAKIVGLEPKQRRSSYEGGEGMWVYTNSEYATLMGCYASAKQHPEMSQIITYAGGHRDHCELVVVWACPHTGVLRKAKLDMHTDEWLYDIKSTRSDHDSFKYSIVNFAYNVQGATYLQAAKHAGLELNGFRFACISKRDDMGYPCWIEQLDEMLAIAGAKENERLMTLYARYGASK